MITYKHLTSGQFSKINRSCIATKHFNKLAMCLCLGPASSGKTLLLKKLQNKDSVDETTSSVPTVGLNIHTIQLDKNSCMNIHELGGMLAPLWHKYFENVKKIIYVVDTSNLCTISAAGVLLYTALANPKLRSAKILLVLTKMDVSYRQMRNEALLMLQLQRLRSEITQNIDVIETSAITGQGCDQLLEWLKK